MEEKPIKNYEIRSEVRLEMLAFQSFILCDPKTIAAAEAEASRDFALAGNLRRKADNEEATAMRLFEMLGGPPVWKKRYDSL